MAIRKKNRGNGNNSSLNFLLDAINSVAVERGGNSTARETGTITDLTDARGTVSGLSGSGATNYAGATNLADSLLKGGASFDDLLNSLRFGGTGDLSDEQKQDFNKQLLETYLKYAAERENRQYNESRLADQRLYDNPLNQLARLMGSGISRDAAIQLLSGGSGSGGSGVITGSTTPVAEGIPASQSALNAEQTKLMPIQTAFGAISAISGLVGLGISIPQAIVQTSAMQIGNAMSKKALIGLQSADAVLGALQDAVSIGALSTKDMDSFSNATDALNYIYDHQDTNAFKPIFANGAFAQVYGTKLGRDMFSQAWDSVRQSKDGGTMLDNYIQQNIARTELANLDIKKSYQELQYAIGELSRQDVEIQRLWNDVWEGNIRIEIAGEELKVKKYEGNRSETFNRVFNKVYNQKYGEGSPDTRDLGSGSSMLAFNAWSDLSMQFYKAFAQNGTSERRNAWERFFLNNNEAAQLLAGLHLNMAKIQESAANPDLNPFTSTLISIWTLAKMTGAYDVLKISADVATDAFPYVLTPNKPQ